MCMDVKFVEVYDATPFKCEKEGTDIANDRIVPALSSAKSKYIAFPSIQDARDGT